MRSLPLLSALCLALPAGAQEPGSTSPLAAFGPQIFELPLHRAPRAQGEPEPALMAVRSSYKASFGASFAFHPFLGSDRPRNLPLEWRTLSIRHGNAEARPSTAPREIAGAWRYERDHGTWSEIYEARRDGVEQSFAIETRLGDGDLVIEGALRTELLAAARGFAASALDFADEHGDVVARYGRAVAFDASGRSADVETSFDGGTIALRVPDAWLDDAAFPILVDPLFSNVLIGSLSAGEVGSLEIAMQDESSAREILVACTRIFSATDHDVYAVVCDEGFVNPIVAHSDTSIAYSDKDVCVAYVPAADRWIIAYQRDYTNASGDFSTVRLFFRDRDAAAPHAGQAVQIALNNTMSLSMPDLGGADEDASTNELGLLVCRQDLTTSRANTPHSEVLAFPIHAGTRSVLTPQFAGTVAVGANLDREMPAVNPERGWDGDGWAIIYKETDASIPAPSGRLQVVRVDSQGAPQEARTLVWDSLLSSTTAPKIAGLSGEFVATYGRTALFGSDRLYGARFTWDWFSNTITTLPRSIAESPNVLERIASSSLAFDKGTMSHWAFAYTDRNAHGSPIGRVLRLGGTAGIVEAQTLTVGGFADDIQAVCMNRGERGFLIAHSSSEAGRPIYGTRLDYSSQAGTTPYGLACGSGELSGSSPYAGNASYVQVLGHAPADTPAVLLVSAAPASLSLDFLGMPGCVDHVDIGAGFLFSLASLTNSFGYATFYQIDLPDSVGSSRVDLQACKLEYSIVSPK